jgi:hypothetical protein
MSALAQATPRAFGTRRIVVAVLLSAGLAAASTLGLVSLHGGHANAPRGHVYTAPGNAFAIAYPAGWQALPEGPTALALRSADGRGGVVVRPSAVPANEALSTLAAQLTAALKKQFPDFKLVSARVAPTRGGAAFLYTFARAKAGVVQSIMVTRVRGRAYSLYGIAPAAAPGLAREVGQILGTFGR